MHLLRGFFRTLHVSSSTHDSTQLAKYCLLKKRAQKRQVLRVEKGGTSDNKGLFACFFFQAVKPVTSLVSIPFSRLSKTISTFLHINSACPHTSYLFKLISIYPSNSTIILSLTTFLFPIPPIQIHIPTPHSTERLNSPPLSKIPPNHNIIWTIAVHTLGGKNLRLTNLPAENSTKFPFLPFLSCIHPVLSSTSPHTRSYILKLSLPFACAWPENGHGG